MTVQEQIREVLAAIYLAGIENGQGKSIIDPAEIMHRKKAFMHNPAGKEAKQAILALIEEIIGEDMTLSKNESTSDWFYGYGYNAAKAEQRTTLRGTE